MDDNGLALAQALPFGGDLQPVFMGVRLQLEVLFGGAQLDMAAAGLTMRANKDP